MFVEERKDKKKLLKTEKTALPMGLRFLFTFTHTHKTLNRKL